MSGHRCSRRKKSGGNEERRDSAVSPMLRHVA
jgi:hypothetical protein